MEISKHYNNSIVLKFDNYKHKYTINGESIPSVTGITGMVNKPALLPWCAKMCSEYFLENYTPGQSFDEVEMVEFALNIKNAPRAFTRRAATAGTIAHEFAEKYINYKLKKINQEPELPINENARNSAEAFLDWVDNNKVKFISSEQKVYSKRFNYTGTTDIDAEVNSERCIVDLKTSSGIYFEMWLQTSGYQQALQEEFGVKYDRRWILRIDKEGHGFYVKDSTNFADDFQVFKACLTLYHASQNFNKYK